MRIWDFGFGISDLGTTVQPGGFPKSAIRNPQSEIFSYVLV